MSNNNALIQISRSKRIEKDRSIAVLRLEQHHKFVVGEPVMVRYYSKDGIDTLFAIGIKEGIGKDCFKILSLKGVELVRSVVTSLPDISQLVNGEVYLYKDNSGVWNYVYQEDNRREIEPIPYSVVKTFLSIDEGERWFWRDGELKREDDFLSTGELNKKLDAIANLLSPPVLNINNETGFLFEEGAVADVTLSMTVTNWMGNDITDSCEFYLDGEKITLTQSNNYIIRGIKTSKIYKLSANYVVDGDIVKESAPVELDIRFGNFFYFGVIEENWKPNEENIVNLGEKKLCTRESVLLSPVNLINQKIAFSYPKSYGYLKSIKDGNGLNYVTDYEVSGVTISGKEYNVYVKGDAVSIDNFSQYFAFNEDTATEDLLYFRLRSMERAWKMRNSANGLLVLDEKGQVPESTIPESLISSIGNSSAVIQLEGFVSSYPLYNLRSGMKWFNTSTNLIYSVLENGITRLDSPSDESLYINKTTNEMFIWDSTESVMKLVGGNVTARKKN